MHELAENTSEEYFCSYLNLTRLIVFFSLALILSPHLIASSDTISVRDKCESLSFDDAVWVEHPRSHIDQSSWNAVSRELSKRRMIQKSEKKNQKKDNIHPAIALRYDFAFLTKMIRQNNGFLTSSSTQSKPLYLYGVLGLYPLHSRPCGVISRIIAENAEFFLQHPEGNRKELFTATKGR